jgi:hypothetical protein
MYILAWLAAWQCIADVGHTATEMQALLLEANSRLVKGDSIKWLHASAAIRRVDALKGDRILECTEPNYCWRFNSEALKALHVLGDNPTREHKAAAVERFWLLPPQYVLWVQTHSRLCVC